MPPDRPAHRRITVTSGSWALGTWEVHAGEPHPWLQPSIIGTYVGWREATTAPVTRRQVATLRVPVIISFEGTYDVRMAGAADTVGSFVAGVSDVPALVTGQATSCAIQVDLTPLGAYRLLRCPVDALTNRLVVAADLMGPGFGELRERLGAAAGWAERFDLLDGFLLSRLAESPAPDARIAFALDQLAAGPTPARVGAIARDLGWSRRHLVERFRSQVGVSPKVAQRILRFEALVAHAARPGRRRWADLAFACGYCDQAHLNRDFAEFAGTTPLGWLRERLPGDAGVSFELPSAGAR